MIRKIFILHEKIGVTIFVAANYICLVNIDCYATTIVTTCIRSWHHLNTVSYSRDPQQSILYTFQIHTNSSYRDLRKTAMTRARGMSISWYPVHSCRWWASVYWPLSPFQFSHKIINTFRFSWISWITHCKYCRALAQYIQSLIIWCNYLGATHSTDIWWQWLKMSNVAIQFLPSLTQLWKNNYIR